MDFFKYAIVDIGANSVRMNIYDINTSTGEFFTVDSVRNMMGLASYVVDGNISADGAGKIVLCFFRAAYYLYINTVSFFYI